MPVKYTKELLQEITELYQSGWTAKDLGAKFEIPERSIIAKLSSLGVYKKKEYRDKQGNPPIKKEVYVEKIANALKLDLDLAESLTKVNKVVLKLILDNLEQKSH
jgi:CRISPR/Cas system CMR subunit Cmr4 (Cas7 group RAMP superfamily)